MPVAEAVTSFLKFLVSLYGAELLAVTTDKLTGWARKLFAKSNILIFGAKETGKSCLITFLTEGKPYTVNDQGERVTPAPTGMGAILGNKVKLDQSAWVKLKKDFPGEVGLRHTWAEGIKEFDPDGIVYMMNGQHLVHSTIDAEAVGKVVEEMFRDVLSSYENSLKNLKALCICLNFKDQWCHNPATEKALLRAVRDVVEKYQDANPVLTQLRVFIHATQLANNSENWNEIKHAMAHFSTDMMGK